MTTSVLMFCPQYLPVIGGAERQAEKLSIALAKHGCRVVVITPQIVANSPLREEYEGIIVERFPLFNMTRKLPWLRGVGLLNLFILNLQIKRVLAKRIDDYDIVHSHIASPLTYFAMLVANKEKKPILCKVAAAGEYNDLNKIKKIGFGGIPIVKNIVKKMPIWVATTKAVKKSLLQHNIPQSRIISIPNGVEYTTSELPVKSWNNSIRFLYLGRLSSATGRDIPTLIHSFNSLASQYEKVELAIVGDGDLYNNIKLLADKSKYRERIHLPGLQTPDPWLEWAQCFVLPSRREGLSNALLEAMAAGLVCIANDIPPNREVLDDGNAGFLVPIENTKALTSAMKNLIDSKDLFKQYQKLSLERIKNHYSIDSVAEQYIQLYRSLIS